MTGPHGPFIRPIVWRHVSVSGVMISQTIQNCVLPIPAAEIQSKMQRLE